ncbi:MAG: OmpA family protein [Halofilum sp. (in: g-proteobacteria)]|nr:OmpA family protein [Halofilum sp. (in: g-proteobacteria)]
MNTLTTIRARRSGVLPLLVLIPLVLSACATGPVSPQAAVEVRSKLTALQNEPELASRARVEIREAEEAVNLAEQPLSESDAELAEHRAYLADLRVEIARARATARLAEAQRPRLAQERDRARLAARTREANQAQSDADRARSEQAVSAADAEREARELQRQIDVLKAESTERGIVLTLGDVLFATNSTELHAGAGRNLDQLVDFLRQYPERTAVIEGHTDSTGTADYNRRLSLQRADSVRNYLAGRGIAGNRLATAGLGEDRPIADNSTANGRQQNRRVEIVITHEPELGSSG